MRICSITSGSAGNCTYLESGASRILIDAGCSGRLLERLIKSLGINPFTLNAIFVTHEHGDHIKGVGVLSRRYHIPVFANEATWQAMQKRVGKISTSHTKVFKNGQFFYFRDLLVHPFSTHHDAADPVGYTFESEGCKAAVLTDTGWIDAHMLEAVSDSDLYYLEANHDAEMLENGPYPPPLKERIRSAHGHLSNRSAALALCDLLRGRGEGVLLAHLSEENNTPELCRQTVCDVLRAEGLDERAQRIAVCPRFEPSAMLSVERTQASFLSAIENASDFLKVVPCAWK